MLFKTMIILAAITGVTSALLANPAIEVQGHRGARGVRPENSLAAFDYALEVGVDVIELDVVVTKDNHVVVNHDPYINADLCLNASGQQIEGRDFIRMLNLADVQSYRCGWKKNPRFPRQILSPYKIPTLDEVFQFVAQSKHQTAKTVRFNIETKTVPTQPDLTPAPEDYARLLLAVIKNHKLEDRVVVQSFDYRTIKATRRISPKIKTAQLLFNTYVDYVAVAKNGGAQIISPDYLSLDKPAVEALHKAGIQTVPWTVNLPEQWDELIKLGVDGIITDFPKELIDHLKQKKLR